MSNTGQCWDQVVDLVQSLTSSYPHLSIPEGLIFVASDKFNKVNDFFGLYEDASIAELEQSAETLCALSYETAVQQHTDYAATVQDYCFYGMYVAALTQEFFGLDPTSRNVLWQTDVDNYPVTWTLGAMIDYIGALTPDPAPRFPVHHVRFFQTDAGVVVIFISILILLLGIIIFILQRRRPSGYIPIHE